MTEKMTETDVLKAMNGLPEEWLEKCYDTRLASVTGGTEEKNGTGAKPVRFRNFGKNAVKWAVAATLALLLCGGGVAYAEKQGLFKFETRNPEVHGANFFLTVEVDEISSEELTGEIREVEEELQEYMGRNDYNQEYPSCLKKYLSKEKARAYIGYEGMKETTVDGWFQEAYVRIFGDKEGKLAEVELDLQYTDGKITITETAEVYTENSWKTTHGTGVRMDDWQNWGVSYRNEEYVTKKGKEVSIVYEERKNETIGNRFMCATLVDGAVYYKLSILYYPQDLERAKEIMYEWCEQF